MQDIATLALALDWGGNRITVERHRASKAAAYRRVYLLLLNFGVSPTDAIRIAATRPDLIRVLEDYAIEAQPAQNVDASTLEREHAS